MKKSLFLIILPIFALCACGSTPTPQPEPEPEPQPGPVVPGGEEQTPSGEEQTPPEGGEQTPDPGPVTPTDPRPDLFLDDDPGYEETIPTLSSFTPTRFSANSFSTTKSENLGEGVRLDTNQFNLNSGKKVVANTLYVDLTKATIKTNYNSAKATVYQSIQDFESKNKNQVIGGINADFFGSNSVNAYVKDNQIIKDSHNDNGVYDYTNSTSDIPASMPMLFGVSGTHSRIGPIVENKTVEQTIKSRFAYKLKYAGADKVVHDIEASFSLSVASVSNKLVTDYTLITEEIAGGVSPSNGDVCYVIQMCEDQHTIKSGKVFDIMDCNGQRIYTTDTVDGYYYLFKKAAVQEELQLNDYIGYLVGNDDTKWDGYTDIIGGRQSLVEDGQIASTVTLENSNGAQNTGVPRSCVGINDKHEVVVVAIEGLRYGGHSQADNDPYGVNLPELAEYMRYIGCYDAMNFDGGGSTQLVVANNNGAGNFELRVRSSDYGSYTLNSCRKVYNTLLVTTK